MRYLRALFAVLVLLLLGIMPLLLLTAPATASPPMAQLVVAPLGVAVMLIRTNVSLPYIGLLLAFLALLTLMASTARRPINHPLLE